MTLKWYDKSLYGTQWKDLSDECRSTKRCVDCGRILTKADLQADHIIEISKQGKNCLANLACRCVSCHKKKTALNKPKWIPKGLGPKQPNFKLRGLKWKK